MANHSEFRRRFDRTIGYRLEALGLWLLLGPLRLLGLDAGSWVMGKGLRLLGPWLPPSRAARRNIARSFPEKSAREHRRILAGSWENFGRTLGEYINLDQLAREWEQRVELVGAEHVRALISDGRPGIIMGGHFGNWELVVLTPHKLGLEMTGIFRRPNNPYAADLLMKARAPLGGKLAPKGKEAARQLMAAMRNGGHVGLLVDQKLNEGISLPFLGREAMTGTVMADLALRYDAPVVPMRTVRTRGARFRVEMLPALEFGHLGRSGDPAQVMAVANGLLEDWVRQLPEQWLWQHRRWPD